jgi:hypothetical protein
MSNMTMRKARKRKIPFILIEEKDDINNEQKENCQKVLVALFSRRS